MGGYQKSPYFPFSKFLHMTIRQLLLVAPAAFPVRETRRDSRPFTPFGLKNLRIFTLGNAVKINLETGLIAEKA